MCRNAWTLLASVAFLIGCGDQADAQTRDLLSRVRADVYREWQRAPGYDRRRASNAPHGGSVDIYVNDVVAQTLAGAEALDEWPVGSIIVKDGFDGADLQLVALMEKRSDGWFWAEYAADGAAAYSGRPDICIDCHQSGDDYVRAFGFR